MADHGHYCLPLLNQREVVGVLVLYLPAGSRRDPAQQAFLVSVADILATFILRQRAEAALKRSEALLERAQTLSTSVAGTPTSPLVTYTGSAETYRIFEIPPGPIFCCLAARVHLDDFDHLLAVRQAYWLLTRAASTFARDRRRGDMADRYGRPVFDGDGWLVGAVGMVQVITAARDALVAW